MAETKEKTYGLYILRTDGDHIIAEESQNFDVLYTKYELLSEQWEECVRETKPFKLKSPIVTSFNPGLIYEITIRPISLTPKNNNNPYEQNMLNRGLGQALNSGKVGNVLDEGYR